MEEEVLKKIVHWYKLAESDYRRNRGNEYKMGYADGLRMARDIILIEQLKAEKKERELLAE